MAIRRGSSNDNPKYGMPLTPFSNRWGYSRVITYRRMTCSTTLILCSAVHCRRSMPPDTPGMAMVNAEIEANRPPVEFLPWIRSSPNRPADSVRIGGPPRGAEPFQVMVNGLGLLLGVGECGVIEGLVHLTVDEHQVEGNGLEPGPERSRM